LGGIYAEKTDGPITIKRIVERDRSLKDINIIVLLDLFNQLHEETDLSKAKSILKTMRIMSGNSEDFTFLKNYENPKEHEIKRAKNKAREFYASPGTIATSPKDSNLTKSLKDWHAFLKILSKTYDFVTRKDIIKDFYSSETKKEKEIDPPLATTIKKFKEQTEPFQQAVKKKHKKMKLKLVGRGKNKYDVGGKMKKLPYSRSKSAPAGFGGN